MILYKTYVIILIFHIGSFAILAQLIKHHKLLEIFLRKKIFKENYTIMNGAILDITEQKLSNLHTTKVIMSLFLMLTIELFVIIVEIMKVLMIIVVRLIWK